MSPNDPVLRSCFFHRRCHSQMSKLVSMLNDKARDPEVSGKQQRDRCQVFQETNPLSARPPTLTMSSDPLYTDWEFLNSPLFRRLARVFWLSTIQCLSASCNYWGEKGPSWGLDFILLSIYIVSCGRVAYPPQYSRWRAHTYTLRSSTHISCSIMANMWLMSMPFGRPTSLNVYQNVSGLGALNRRTLYLLRREEAWTQKCPVW